jgi:hypothetical protein
LLSSQNTCCSFCSVGRILRHLTLPQSLLNHSSKNFTINLSNQVIDHPSHGAQNIRLCLIAWYTGCKCTMTLTNRIMLTV